MKPITSILFITLSNIGDVLLTLPALDYLRGAFPGSKITVVCGPRTEEIFKNNPLVHESIVFNKRAGLSEQIRFFCELKNSKYDIVVDLRNSLFGILLPARNKISPFLTVPRAIAHMKDRHLFRVKSMTDSFFSLVYKHEAALAITAQLLEMSRCHCESAVGGRSNLFFRLLRRFAPRNNGQTRLAMTVKAAPEMVYFSPEDGEYIGRLLKTAGINAGDKFLVVSAGARSDTKRWMESGFAGLIIECVRGFGMKVVLTGDKAETGIAKNIVDGLPSGVKGSVGNLAGKTGIAQLAYLLTKAVVLVTNDSASLHLAGYLDIPTVAIFGPTDDAKYGPWAGRSAVVKKEIFCRPCSKAQCRFNTLDCLRLIKVEDVLQSVRRFLEEEKKY
jgi:ADP-heptose:LPS heptosyltransferase